jgi:hypothetical protein
LKVELPKDWKREDGDDSIIFEGPRGTDHPPAIARIKKLKEAPESSAAAYTAYMKRTEFWDKGTRAELVGKAQDWPGGFAASYKVFSEVDPKHPSLAFFAAWKVDDALLECQGRIVPDESARDQIAKLCQSARW